MELYTMGYGRWPTKQRLANMIQVLKTAEVSTLVDIRHSPCSSNLAPDSNYGPRAWHLQTEGHGIMRELENAGIEYVWLGELGNPQKNDPHMTVLRAHIESADERWPVNRGFRTLLHLVDNQGKRCCLLCACKDYETCHRKIIAETFRNRFLPDQVTICDYPYR